MPGKSVQIIPFSEKPLDFFAEKFITENSKDLPNLSGHVILLANTVAAPELRRCLLHQASQFKAQALLGPNISTVKTWVNNFIPVAENNNQEQLLCSETAQKLILVDVLRRFPAVTGEVNPWAYVDDLMQLFNALTLANIKLPDSAEAFIEKIASAYAIQQHDRQTMAPFYSREATLVYKLWHAWHEELTQAGQIDMSTAYSLALQNSLTDIDKLPHLHILGYHDFKPVELAWLSTLLEAGKATYYLGAQLSEATTSNSLHPAAVIKKQLEQLNLPVAASSTDDFYQRIFNSGTSLKKETLDAVYADWQQNTNCKTFLANNTEEEARAVDIQVRQWLLQGKTNIGIVTENRVLARRVRALLDRSNIIIQDLAGWALSTTRFAGLVEHWLQCIEENFSYLPFLDIIKSPHCFPEIDIEQQQHAAYRFEHDLVTDENVMADLEAYRKASQDRCARLAEYMQADNTLLNNIFKLTEQAAEPLVNCLGSQSLPAEKYINALQASLEKIGLYSALNNDAAGQEIINIIQAMANIQQGRSIHISWQEFRLWFGTQIETARFRPANGGQSVKLMGLSQAQLQNFDAVIIAGLEHDILPGHSHTHTFFNDAVKYELNLPTSTDVKNEKFYHFRYLLSCAPVQLLTARKAQHGEPVNLSPWLELIRTAHHIMQQDIDDTELAALASNTQNQVYNSETDALPGTTVQPRPSINPDMLPEHLSASAYQQLIDCPYRFFAERCLRLKPIDEIRLQLSKADFGQRVHKCLEAFHRDVDNLPGPFTQPINEATREQAVALLNELGDRVFRNDIRVHYEHQAWLKQWLAIVPKFVDWLIPHAVQWQLQNIESVKEVTLELANQRVMKLTGTLDRIDSKQAGTGIIDYKTGQTGSQSQVKAGEVVQLPFYALLAEDAQAPILQVSYLALGREKVKEAATIKDDILKELVTNERQRLIEILNAIHNHAPLPAWGDDKTCDRCDMEGLCRKESWQQLIN